MPEDRSVPETAALAATEPAAPRPAPPRLSLRARFGRAKGKATRRLVRTMAKFLARELFRGALKREADPEGLASVTAAIRQNGGIAPALGDMLESPEFAARTGSLTLPAVVTGIFKGLLGRDPDPDGLTAALGFMRDHNDLPAMVAVMTQSDEFKRRLFTTPRNAPMGDTVMVSALTRPRQGRLIIVSSNCQTAGIASTLQGCLPDDILLPIPLPDSTDPDINEHFAAEVSRADAWVTMNWQRHGDQILGPEKKSSVQLVKLPMVTFPAFHPDLCYAWQVATQRVTSMHYSSAITAWAYNRGATLEDTRKLFTRATYAALGYFDLWQPSMNLLRGNFEACELDFARYMLAMKRRGVFMHTLDHPKVAALVELAKLVSLKLGAPESTLDKGIDIADGLTGDVWPLYPEVADEFSLPHGSYDWKLRNTWIAGLDHYLEYAFGEYAAEQIPTGGLRLQNRDWERYDRVLEPQLGKAR